MYTLVRLQKSGFEQVADMALAFAVMGEVDEKREPLGGWPAASTAGQRAGSCLHPWHVRPLAEHKVSPCHTSARPWPCCFNPPLGLLIRACRRAACSGGPGPGPHHHRPALCLQLRRRRRDQHQGGVHRGRGRGGAQFPLAAGCRGSRCQCALRGPVPVQPAAPCPVAHTASLCHAGPAIAV